LLNGWHGYPPHITSGRTTFRQLMVLMSPWFGTSGQCLDSTRHAYGSISDCHMTFIPARSKPRSRPPMPLNSEPTVSTSVTFCIRLETLVGLYGTLRKAFVYTLNGVCMRYECHKGR
jgi:hypothetical protein